MDNIIRLDNYGGENHDYHGDIEGGAWVKAADLQGGDHLLDADGDFVLVKNAVIIEQELEAWNLTVADTHTFFVHGADAAANDNMPLDGVLQNISLTPPHLDKNAVWVHNCNKKKRQKKKTKNDGRKKKDDVPDDAKAHPYDLSKTPRENADDFIKQNPQHGTEKGAGRMHNKVRKYFEQKYRR